MTWRLNNPPDVLMVDGAVRMVQVVDGVPGVGRSIETFWYDADGKEVRKDCCMMVTEVLFDVRPESANIG